MEEDATAVPVLEIGGPPGGMGRLLLMIVVVRTGTHELLWEQHSLEVQGFLERDG